MKALKCRFGCSKAVAAASGTSYWSLRQQSAVAVVDGLCQPSFSRRNCLVHASAVHKEHHERSLAAIEHKKPTAMPKLPDRASNHGSQGLSRQQQEARPSGRRRTPLPPSMPPDQQQRAQERTIAGLLAYSGLLGTLATVISTVCPDVDLFGNFHLDAADITVGLQLVLPCCLLNLAIMLPDYSSWRVPPEPTVEEQQQMAESLLAWTVQQQAAAAAVPSSSSSNGNSGSNGTTGADADKGTLLSSNSDSTATTNNTTLSSSGQQGQASMPRAAQSSSSSSSSGTSTPEGRRASELLPTMPPAYFLGNAEPPLPPALARCKDALLMAQGHYLAPGPRQLPWHLQAGLLLVNCLAAELLFRSVALQVSGGWLTDRMLEAGAEDWFTAAAAHLPVLPTPHMSGQLLALALLSGASLVSVARQVMQMTRRPSFVMASQGKATSGQLLADISKLVGQKDRQQQQRQQQQDRGHDAMHGYRQKDQSQQQQQSSDTTQLYGTDMLPGSQSGVESEPAGKAPGRKVSGAQVSKQQSPSQRAADLAAAAAGTHRSTSRSSSAHSSSSSRNKGGVSAVLSNTLSALALSQGVIGVRDLSQSIGLGLAYVMTGNLAASFVAAVVTEGMMAVLQRRGQERSRQRSIAFAKHFASFSRAFRDAQRKQLLHKDQQQQQPVAPASSTAEGSQAHASCSPGTPADGSSSSSRSNSSHASDTGFAAAVATDAATLQAAAAAASDAGSSETVAAAAAANSSRMEQTISVLDQLLGEQLGNKQQLQGPTANEVAMQLLCNRTGDNRR